MIILKTRSEVKVTITFKCHTTLCHLKMHPHITFGLPTSKNIEVMPNPETRSEVKVSDQKMKRDNPPFQDALTH